MLYRVLVAIISVLLRTVFRLKIEGRENLPEGAMLLCGNHTSLTDPVFIAVGIGPRKPLRFMAKAELIEKPVFGKLLKAVGAFPVKRGAADIGAIKTALSVLNSGGKLVLFPEGRRVSADESAEAKTGVAMLSYRTGAPVIPVYLKSVPLRPFVRTRVRFGKPVFPPKLEGKPTPEHYRQFADLVMERIRELKAV